MDKNRVVDHFTPIQNNDTSSPYSSDSQTTFGPYEWIIYLETVPSPEMIDTSNISYKYVYTP